MCVWSYFSVSSIWWPLLQIVSLPPRVSSLILSPAVTEPSVTEIMTQAYRNYIIHPQNLYPCMNKISGYVRKASWKLIYNNWMGSLLSAVYARLKITMCLPKMAQLYWWVLAGNYLGVLLFPLYHNVQPHWPASSPATFKDLTSPSLSSSNFPIQFFSRFKSIFNYPKISKLPST